MRRSTEGENILFLSNQSMKEGEGDLRCPVSHVGGEKEGMKAGKEGEGGGGAGAGMGGS